MGFGQKMTLQIFNRVEMGFVTTKKSQFTSKCASSAQSILHFLIVIFIYLAALGLSCSMQDLQLQHSNTQLQHVGSSSLMRDQTQAPCTGRAESQPLDHQGSAHTPFLKKLEKKQISFGVDVSLWQKMFYSRKTSCYCFWLVALKCSKHCNVLDAQGGGTR